MKSVFYNLVSTPPICNNERLVSWDFRFRYDPKSIRFVGCEWVFFVLFCGVSRRL